ncbi:MATE efflux family protein [gut metagenome]|uniref:MATE efflux family protein n=1 Tax=gut metagenome TaxID=749906 RepID=J9GJT4_9ZZZZ
MLNILLDPIFIFVFKLDISGAAIATVISQAASCAYVLRFLFGPIPPIHITFGGYDFRLMSRILALGFTPFAIILMDNLMIIALNALLQKYGGSKQGDLLIAAATIAQSFMLVVTMPMGGITGGTGSILGYNLGAGRPDRILEAQKWILGLCLVYTTFLTMAGQFIPSPFVSIFTKDPAVAKLAVAAIRICTLGLIPLAIQYVVVDGFTGMGMMRYSLPLSFFRKLVYFIPLFIFPAYFGAMSTFLAEPISDFIAPIVCSLVYLRRIRFVVGMEPRH